MSLSEKGEIWRRIKRLSRQLERPEPVTWSVVRGSTRAELEVVIGQIVGRLEHNIRMVAVNRQLTAPARARERFEARYGAFSHTVSVLFQVLDRRGEKAPRSKTIRFNTQEEELTIDKVKTALDTMVNQYTGGIQDLEIVSINTIETRDVRSIRGLPLFRAILTYPTLGVVAEKWTDQNGVCAYEKLSGRLRMTFEEIEAHVGKVRDTGLTPDDILLLYKIKKNRSLKIIDLRGDLTVSYDTTSLHVDMDVFMSTGNHLYELTEERRTAIINKFRGHSHNITEDALDIQKGIGKPSTPHRVHIEARDFDHAMELARDNSFDVDQIMGRRHVAKVIRELKSKTKSDVAELADAIRLKAETKTQYHRDHAKYREQVAIVRGLRVRNKARKIQYTKEIKAAKLKSRQKKPKKTGPYKRITIHVPKENLYDDYLKLLWNGIAYPTDIDGKTVKTINIQKCKRGLIIIKASMDYKQCKQSACDLGIDYKNQTPSGLGWEYFQKINAGWENTYYNNQVRELVDKHSTIGGLNMRVAHTLSEGESYKGIDFYRHYPSIALNGGFYTMDVKADIKKFNNDINQFNIYYVETNDTTLFDGNGMYDHQLVSYGSDIGLIKPGDIKLQIAIKPSPKNDAIVHTFIKDVYAKVSDDSMRKKIVNFFIGRLGSTGGDKVTKRTLTTNFTEANYYYTTSDSLPTDKTISNIGEYCDPAFLGTPEAKSHGKPIFLVEEFKRERGLSSNRLINMAIVQRGRVATHKLAQEISKTNNVVCIRTDCVIYVDDGWGDHPDISVPKVPTFGDCRHEVVHEEMFAAHVKQPKLAKYINRKVNWRVEKTDPDTYYDWRKILKYDRAYIAGFAGSGKSHMIRALKEHLEKDPRNVVECGAFTNTAGLNIEGNTLHSLLGVAHTGRVFEKRIQQFFRRTTHLLIDEVSMIPLEIFRILSQIPKRIKIYGFGDMRQFPPIDEDYDMEQTQMFRSLFGGNKIELSYQCRSDSTYANQCVGFYETGVLPEGITVLDKYDKLPDVNISHTNVERRSINAIKIAEYVKELSVEMIPIVKRYRNTTKPVGTVYTMEERFDIDKLAYIVNNKEKFPEIIDSHNLEDHDVFLIPSKYLVNAVRSGEYGVKTVHYKYAGASKKGRVYADKSQSLQNITRQIRHTIARDHYHDIDMENAHPRILQHICRAHEISTPKLDEYVLDRDRIIGDMKSQYQVGKSPVKVAILSIMNGGAQNYKKLMVQSGKGTNKWMEEFTTEVSKIHQMLARRYPTRYRQQVSKRTAHGKNYNHKASFCNILMCEMENDILQCMYATLKKDGLVASDVVLCFDGIMILKNSRVDEDYLRKMELDITSKFGIVIRLEKKAMDEHVKLPDDIPRYEAADNPQVSSSDIYDEFPAVYENMPIIANSNRHRSQNNYLNNQQFTITEVPESYPDVEKDATVKIAMRGGGSEPITISFRELQRDFRPAYCITAYKSQGMTISEPHMVHGFDGMGSNADRNGQYVCITRTTDVKFLTVISEKKKELVIECDDAEEAVDDSGVWAWVMGAFA